MAARRSLRCQRRVVGPVSHQAASWSTALLRSMKQFRFVVEIPWVGYQPPHRPTRRAQPSVRAGKYSILSQTPILRKMQAVADHLDAPHPVPSKPMSDVIVCSSSNHGKESRSLEEKPASLRISSQSFESPPPSPWPIRAASLLRYLDGACKITIGIRMFRAHTAEQISCWLATSGDPA